jgi:hypothetical protein
LPGTPQATVPALADGQYLMQWDAIYNPTTNQKTWSIPYQSSAKFGSLSAQSTNTGTLTITGDISSANGKFLVDANGQMTASAATFKSADGTVMFTTGTGLTLAAAPAGTKNSELTASITAAQNTANSARDAGITANNAIAAIGSDYILDRSEKPRIITEFTAIDTERTGIAKSATDLGISAATYQGTINNLAAFLTNNVGSSTSDWSNVLVDSPFDGPYMRDRFVDVYRERQKILDAVAAKLQANAAAAATTATAAGLSGQMSVPQVAQFLPPGGVTNALFGGDLYSSDWNGYTDYRMRGWYLQRSGNFFGYNVVLRGAIMSANMPAVGTWLPAGGGNVMYFGPEGMQVGNFNDGRFVYIAANGDIQAPGLALIDKQLTLTNPVIIAPKISTTFAATVPRLYLTRQINGSTVSTGMGVGVRNGSGNYSYSWTFTSSSGEDLSMTSSPGAASATIRAQGSNEGLYGNASLTEK